MHTKISTVVLSTLVLTACGGGGGGGGSNTPPETVTIATSPAISIAENNPLSVAIEAMSSNSTSTGITFSVSGGADADLFSFNGSNLVASANFDFENPQDVNGDNVYEFQVTATSSTGATATAPFTVQVSNIVEISFQSTTDASVEENTSFSLPITVAADGVQNTALTLAISGGADAQLFTISDSGDSLVASQTFDFEAPLDGDTDNVYEVEVSATDSTGATTSELFQVSVTNQFTLSHELVFPTQNSNIAIEMTLEELQASGKTEFEAVAKLIDLEDGEVTAEEAATMLSFTINGQSLVQSAEFPDFWSAAVPVIPGANDFQSELVATANNTETQTVTAFNNLLYANPQFLDISSDGNLIYFSAADSSLSSTLIIRFNISSGIYQLISSDLTADGITLVSGSRNRTSNQLDTGVLDEINQRLFYSDTSDTSVNRILEIDVATGTRSQTSITFAPDTANTPANIFGYDSSQNLIYLSDSRGVFTLNPDAEVITALGFSSSRNLTLDSTNNRILIPNTTALSSYNITTGATSTLFTYSNAGVEFTPDRVDLSSGNSVVLSSRTEAVRVNLSDLSVTQLVSVDAVAAGNNPINSGASGDVFFNDIDNSLYNFSGAQRLTSLNGNNDIYMPVIIEGGEGDFILPIADRVNRSASIFDFENERVFAFSQNIDTSTNIATSLGFYQVNLNNGNSTLLFEREDIPSSSYSGFSAALAFDDARENLYFIDSIESNLYELNLETLEISLQSSLSMQFDSEVSIGLRMIKLEGEDTLLVFNSGGPASGIYSLDIFSGELFPISTTALTDTPELTVGTGVDINFPATFIFDPQNPNESIILNIDSIVSVDQNSGNRAMLGQVLDYSNVISGGEQYETLDFVRESDGQFLILSQAGIGDFGSIVTRYNPQTNEHTYVFGGRLPSPFGTQRFNSQRFYYDKNSEIFYFDRDNSIFERGIFAFSPISREYIGLSF